VPDSDRSHPASSPDPESGSTANVGEGSPALRLREDFARDFLVQVSRLLDVRVSCRCTGIAKGSRAGFLNSVEDGSCCFRLGAEGEGDVWLEFSPPLAFVIIDCLLGDPQPGQFVPRRPMTGIERQLLARVAVLARDCLRRPAAGGESKRSFSVGALPESIGDRPAGALTATFEISVAEESGTMRICVAEATRRAESSFAAAGESAPIELSATITDTDIDAADLAGLACGDVITTDTLAEGEVVIRIAGIPKYLGKLGAMNGKRAITITRRLDGRPPAPDGEASSR